MNEKTSPWFKVLALCTAIGLGGAYVWRQQQQATPPVVKPAERTVLSSSKSFVIVPAALPVDQENADRVLMQSSKSGVFKLPQEEPHERILLPSSKSSITMPIFRERHSAPADQPKPAEP